MNFIPDGNTSRVNWLNNFAIKLGQYSELLGISYNELLTIRKDAYVFQYTLNIREMDKQKLSSLPRYKNFKKCFGKNQDPEMFSSVSEADLSNKKIEEKIFERVGKLVNRIRTSPGYTETIGEDLKMETPVIIYNPLILQPQLMVKLKAGHPYITCIKGKSNGIELYADRNDGNNWVFIGRFLRIEYIDMTPLPQNNTQWNYKAFYMLGYNRIGHVSSIASVVVGKAA